MTPPTSLDPARSRGSRRAEDLGVTASHRVIDTPVVTAAVTQYDGHAVAYRCGRVHAATAPAGAREAGTATYGLNLPAWAVLLLAAPPSRTAEAPET